MSFPPCKFPSTKKVSKEIKCKYCCKCSEYCLEICLNNAIADVSLNGSQTITTTPTNVIFNNVSVNVGNKKDCCRKKCCSGGCPVYMPPYNNCFPFYNPINGTAVVPYKSCGYYVIATDLVLGDHNDTVTATINVNGTVLATQSVVTGVNRVSLMVFQNLMPGNVIQVQVSGADGTVVTGSTLKISKLL